MPLGKDLAAIRVQQNLSIEDIHDATRIPVYTIQEIESETIFNDERRNTTYMRSFVRTYAKALKIDDADAVVALDQMADDTYRGSILKKYGDGSTPSPKKESSKTVSASASKSDKQSSSSSNKPSKDSDSQDDAGLKEITTKGEVKSGEKKTESKSAPDSAKEKSSEEAAKSTRYAGETKTTRPPVTAPSSTVDDTPDVKSINWADTGRKMYTFRNNKKYIYGSVVALLIVIIAGYLLFRDTEEPIDEPEIASETLPEENGILPETPLDTTATTDIATAPDAVQPDPAAIDTTDVDDQIDEQALNQNVTEEISTTSDALPDTLILTVYAQNDKLEPVRVKSDIVEDYSPYWIEKGVAMRFEFTEEIHVRGQYTRMGLFVNGHFMENFRDYRGEDNQIHITRELLEEDPQLWIPQQLSVGEADVALPDTVINRPTF